MYIAQPSAWEYTREPQQLIQELQLFRAFMIHLLNTDLELESLRVSLRFTELLCRACVHMNFAILSLASSWQVPDPPMS